MSPGSTGQSHRTRWFLHWAAMPGSRLGAALLCPVLVGAVLLGAAGCSAPAPELGGEAAKALQAQVLAVTEAAAANDPAGSLKLLDELGTKLDQAAANGEVSPKRHQDIRSAMDAVRADLNALQAAEEAARAAAEEAAKAAAEEAAPPAPPPVAPPPAPAPAPADDGKANDGKGDVGKGDDKGGDRGKGKD